MYLSNTNATPDEYSFKALNDSLKKLPASYKNGDLPTAKELYSSPAETEQNWRVVAASVYAYIGTHDGIGQLLGSGQAAIGRYEPDGSGVVYVGVNTGLRQRGVAVGTRWPLEDWPSRAARSRRSRPRTTRQPDR